MIPDGKTLIAYQDAVEALTENERLKATIYAMNTLLIQKGIYSVEEFRFHFRQSAQRQLSKRS